jgi:hypothetical protein
MIITIILLVGSLLSLLIAMWMIGKGPMEIGTPIGFMVFGFIGTIGCLAGSISMATQQPFVFNLIVGAITAIAGFAYREKIFVDYHSNQIRDADAGQIGLGYGVIGIIWFVVTLVLFIASKF